ncbi:MAG: SCO family protein [Acidobacteria bacterium]|nr:SCO family protein [Acidobacteriota bacterium]
MRRAAFAALLLISLTASSCKSRRELPVLYPVPAETLTDDAGRPKSLAELTGHATVYAFIFTRCAGVCPTMMLSMKSLAAEVPQNLAVRYVLVSVDPAYDSPAVLAAYRKKHGVGDAWTFLTGTREQVSTLSIGGFKLAAPRDGGEPDEPIVHSTKFVVADKKGQIRGYYDSFDAEQLAALREAVVALAKE